MMNKRSFLSKISITGVLVLTTALLLLQCKDPDISLYTTSDVNITGYFEKNTDSFSEFLKILKRTGDEQFLNAYGTYTVFAPDNTAIAKYLQNKGKTSVEEFETEELKELVKFHVLADTISTTGFSDGKLTTPTMLGQFLITGATNINGTSYITVNRQAKLTRGNITCGNGIIHVIDYLLEPATLTVVELIAQNPDYTIFNQALMETGYDDLLNTIPTNTGDLSQWYTIIAETDSIFNADGYADYAAVKARFSHLNDPANKADSLNLFVAYRILPGLKYVADIVTASSHSTLASSDVITVKLDGQTIRINADIIAGVQEPGSTLLRNKSDNAATNGVLHAAGSTYAIKVRTPFAVYWDVADQPECRNLTSIFRKTGSYAFQVGDLANINNASTMGTNTDYLVTYVNGGAEFYYGDYLQLGRMVAGRQNFVEFTTPLLVKGKYKVWICYRVRNYNDLQAYFNDEALPRIFGLNPGVTVNPALKTPREWEALGWKNYTKTPSQNFVGRLLGTVEVTTTGTQKFKIVTLTSRAGSTGTAFYLDMIHFIPTNQDQIYPVFGVDGAQWDENGNQVN